MTLLPELRSAAFHRQWEFSVLHNLSASAAETLPMHELLRLARPAEREDWEKLTLGYLETRGTVPLRNAVASLYEKAEPNDVLMFSGGKDALFATFQTLVEPGDHVITIVPNYQPLEAIPSTISKVSAVGLRAEDGWKLSIDTVIAALKPNTKLICINFPHNPTGAILDQTTFDALVTLADERGIYILSDEVYRGLEGNPVDRRPAIVDVYRRGISLNVLSKAWGLAGLRIGWIASRDPEVLRRIETVQAYLFDGHAGPSDILGRIALHASQSIIARNVAIITENRLALDKFFARYVDRFDWQPPLAGCIAFPRYIGPGDVETFCEILLTQSGIALMPASVYQSPLAQTSSDHFRIGFGKSSFQLGINALSAVLDST